MGELDDRATFFVYPTQHALFVILTVVVTEAYKIICEAVLVDQLNVLADELGGAREQTCSPL